LLWHGILNFPDLMCQHVGPQTRALYRIMIWKL